MCYCTLQAGGGRNEVDPRFLSLFSAFNATFPSMESLSHIYFSVITGHLQTFKKGIYTYTLAHTDTCGGMGITLWRFKTVCVCCKVKSQNL